MINNMIKIIARIIIAIVLLPVWMVWLLMDLAFNGSDYEHWELYDLFIRSFKN